MWKEYLLDDPPLPSLHHNPRCTVWINVHHSLVLDLGNGKPCMEGSCTIFVQFVWLGFFIAHIPRSIMLALVQGGVGIGMLDQRLVGRSNCQA